MAIPGINVVSAAEFAGEMGPLKNNASPNAITGRAGLFPGKHQSDQVSHERLPLIRAANKRLRNALMQIAENLIACNQYFRLSAATWKLNKVPTRIQRTRVARRFARIAYSMVGGEQVFIHPCCREPNTILEKLLTFLIEHQSKLETIQQVMMAAMTQIPNSRRLAEGNSLKNISPLYARKKGAVRHVSEVLNLIVAKLLDQPLQSTTEEAASD